MAWVGLARGRAVGVNLGADDVRGMTGHRPLPRGHADEGRVRRACMSHAFGLLLGGSELGLTKVGYRRRGLAGGGLVGVGFVGGKGHIGKKRGKREREKRRKEKKKKRREREVRVSVRV